MRHTWDELFARERNKIRYEVQLRAPALTSAGLDTVGDLTPKRLWEQSAKYFTRSQFGAVVGDGAGWLTDIVLPRLREIGVKHLDAVLGQAYLERRGLPAPASRNTAARNRKLAVQWGISGRDLDDGGYGRVRLDLQSGMLQSVDGSLGLGH